MYLDKKITILVAVADNGVMSHEGEAPWNIPEWDALVLEFIASHPVIMGRKTLQKLGRPIAVSQNIILTKKGAGSIEGVDLSDTQIFITNRLRAAVGIADGHDVFVIGGQKVFKEALEIADEIVMMRVHQQCAGDRFFQFEAAEWTETSAIPKDGYTLFTYRRNQ